MILSARPTVPSTLLCFARFWKVETDDRCNNTTDMIVGAEWINIVWLGTYKLFESQLRKLQFQSYKIDDRPPTSNITAMLMLLLIHDIILSHDKILKNTLYNNFVSFIYQWF